VPVSASRGSFPHSFGFLHGNGNGDKDVVFGLGLHRQCDLIDAQADPAGHAVDERPLPVQTRIGDSKKSAKSRDDRDLRGVDRKKLPRTTDSTRKTKKENTNQLRNVVGSFIFLVSILPLGAPN
jgi:hypothetical protein